MKFKTRTPLPENWTDARAFSGLESISKVDSEFADSNSNSEKLGGKNLSGLSGYSHALSSPFPNLFAAVKLLCFNLHPPSVKYLVY